MARSITFLSSLTLPGHGYDSRILHGLVGNLVDLLSHFFLKLPDKCPGQERNIFRTLTKRRNYNGKYIQPVEEILPEFAGRHFLLQCPGSWRR